MKNAAGETPATGLPSRRRPTHPGVILLEQFPREIPMSQAEAARRLGHTGHARQRARPWGRGVTARSALGLGRLLGTTPMFWMNLQATYDLGKAVAARRTA